jgi:hypothetical protein
METTKNAGIIRTILSQPANNTTTWIGHLQSDPVSHLAGQTFISPEDGMLESIQVYSSLVQYPGKLTLTLHEFDDDSKNWTHAFAESSFIVSKNDKEKWLTFHFDFAELTKNQTYGFRLQSPDAMIGIGELARSNDQPCLFGQEWNADSNNIAGSYFSWFSLAFKLQMAG